MADINSIVQVALDARKGCVEKYSTKDANELVRQAMIELNGGSTKLNYKNIRDGKCVGLFALVEELLSRTVVEGLMEDDFFMNMVDFRNLKLGDENLFNVEDNDLFSISKAADGTQGIRRQRLGGVSQTSITTDLRVVKIYEELNRVLAGQVDFNNMIQKVGESFRRNFLEEIYALWMGATADQFGGATYFPAAGSYDEDALLDLISHVEAAANGQQATIVGTKKALRKLMPAIQSDGYKDDLYNMGYAGKFYATPVVALPQRHKLNSTEFVFDDNTLTIIAGQDKPIKCVYEGDSTIIPGDPLTNQDLTQTYMYAERYGLGIILAGGNAGIGRYQIA